MNERRVPGLTLVTGATGLVGNNVLRALLEAGIPVRALARPTSDLRCLEGLQVEVVQGDVTDQDSLQRAVAGVNSVVHAAGCVLLGWKNVDLHDRVNRLGAQQMARAARQEGARMVHVSTVNALGVGRQNRPADEEWVAGPNVPCPYVLSKQAGQEAVRAEIERGLDGLIVYPGFMLGPWDWKPSSGLMLIEVARRFTPLAPAGGFSVGDVRDVAQAILAALRCAPTGREYVLAGHNMTYLEVWKRFAAISGGRAPLCRSGPLLRIAAGRIGDLWGTLTGHEPDVNSAAVKLSDHYHYFRSARAMSELDYRIRPVDESIRDAWQWLRGQGMTK